MRVYKNLDASKPLDQLTDADNPVLITKNGLLKGDELTLVGHDHCVRIATDLKGDIFMTSRHKPEVFLNNGMWCISIYHE